MNRDELFYNEATRQTNEQYESNHHFNGIASQILGFSALVFSLLIFKVSNYSTLQLAFFCLSLIFFISVAISTIRVLWIRKWSFSPKLSELYENVNIEEFPDDKLVLLAGNSLSAAIDDNDEILTFKAKLLQYAYVYITLEVISIGLLVFSSII